jgi:penicillin-binding protein 1B
VEQAARAYFDKDLKDLSLAEAAAIAAMIKNPRKFSPDRNPEGATARRTYILDRMQELGFTNSNEVELARATTIKLAPPKRNDHATAPYFVDSALKELNTKFEGDYLNSNLNTRVYTTIDTQMQSLAEQAVAKHLAGLDKWFAKKGKNLQATIVALDPHTGHILAMVGGRDYRESQFNRATDALRAPGSTFKPVVYATAFERGYTPISVSADKPTEFATIGAKPYKPENYHGAYANTNITMKTALVKSSNVVAVRTAMDVGLGAVANKARELGFEDVKAYPSMALGTLEVTPIQLAAAYASFANGGKRVTPTFIDKIVSGEENLIYLSAGDDKQVMKEQTAYMVTDALMDVVKRGTGAKAAGALGDVAFAGKTGTTKDGWFVGYTPNLVTVAWVGLDDNEDLHATGGDIALPLWVNFMRDVVRLRPEYGGKSFAMPKGLAQVVVDPETGMAAGPYCPMRESAVVPTSAATYVHCWKHQPLNSMFAMASVNETDPTYMQQVTTDVPAYQSPAYTTSDSSDDHRLIYEEVEKSEEELNIRRATPTREERPQSSQPVRVDESYLDSSDRARVVKKPRIE